MELSPFSIAPSEQRLGERPVYLFGGAGRPVVVQIAAYGVRRVRRVLFGHVPEDRVNAGPRLPVVISFDRSVMRK